MARAAEGDTAMPNACLSFPECEACPTFPDCPSSLLENCYQPMEEAVFTTGTAQVTKGLIILTLPGNPAPPPGVSGEPFDCATWQVGDGAGRLVLGLADFDDAFAGDTAVVLRLSDR